MFRLGNKSEVNLRSSLNCLKQAKFGAKNPQFRGQCSKKSDSNLTEQRCRICRMVSKTPFHFGKPFLLGHFSIFGFSTTFVTPIFSNTNSVKVKWIFISKTQTFRHSNSFRIFPPQNCTQTEIPQLSFCTMLESTLSRALTLAQYCAAATAPNSNVAFLVTCPKKLWVARKGIFLSFIFTWI